MTPSADPPAATSSLVCHLIDGNLDTAYFRSIALRHSKAFPVMIGSLAPSGSLQEAMRILGTPTFALGATRRASHPAAITRLMRLLRHEDIGILHAHCFDPTLLGLIAARLAGRVFVFTRHHSDHNIRLGKRWHTRIDSWCARHADHVIAVSEATRRTVVDVEGVPESRISVVLNGIEDVPQPPTARVEAVRRELGLEGVRCCLVVARLHEEKGHLVLFDAIPEVTRRHGLVVFLMVGEGPHRAIFEREVRVRGLTKSVRFLGRRSDVPHLICATDLVVLPSLAESFGFVLVEAMSLGKPIVATTTGGIPEVVAHGETGLLVSRGDAGALAEAICLVLEDPGLSRRLGEAGRLRARRFTAEAMVRGYERVYQSLL